MSFWWWILFKERELLLLFIFFKIGGLDIWVLDAKGSLSTTFGGVLRSFLALTSGVISFFKGGEIEVKNVAGIM